MNDPDYRGEKYEEFRDTEKAMKEKDYPQAGPPYDKTTYMGRIRDEIAIADNAFAQASCDYHSVVNILQETIANWYSVVNDAISMINGGIEIERVRKYLVDMRRAYTK